MSNMVGWFSLALAAACVVVGELGMASSYTAASMVLFCMEEK